MCIDDLGIIIRGCISSLNLDYISSTTISQQWCGHTHIIYNKVFMSYQKSDIVSAVLAVLILLGAFSTSEPLQIQHPKQKEKATRGMKECRLHLTLAKRFSKTIEKKVFLSSHTNLSRYNLHLSCSIPQTLESNHLQNTKQLDIKVQRGPARDDTSRAPITVRQPTG